MRIPPLRWVHSVCLLPLLTMPIWASDLEVSEYALKAGFLSNFINFIAWPAPPVEQVNLCVVGENPFDDKLDVLVEKNNALGKQKKVKVTYNNHLDAVERCHLVYISGSEQSHVAAILERLAPYPVVTVSSIPGFAEQGGQIEFTTEDSRVRFHINHKIMKEKNINPDANLLRVASKIL